jgi:hypothetical protein
VEILFVTFGAVDFRAIFSCCGILTPLLLLQASFQAVHFLGCFKNRCFGGPFLGCQAKEILDQAKSLAHYQFFLKVFYWGVCWGLHPLMYLILL